MSNFDVTLLSEDGSQVATFTLESASEDVAVVQLEHSYPGAAIMLRAQDSYVSKSDDHGRRGP